MKKTVLSVAVWLAALCVCLLLADRMTRRDDGARKYDAFFAEEQPIDVFFLGTSRVLDGVSPMELWRDFGITSYNLANSSEVLDVTEQVLRLALESHTPKVAVIDVYYVHHSVDERWTYPYRHLFFDEIPLSRAKLEAVHATLPQSEWLEFLMPFSLYHGRWEELLSGRMVFQILGMGLIVPVTEELVFRGLVYRRLERYLPGAAAVLLGAALFAAYHGNLLQVLFAFPMGIVLILLYRHYGTLKMPILFHAASNLTAILLGAGI